MAEADRGDTLAEVKRLRLKAKNATRYGYRLVAARYRKRAAEMAERLRVKEAGR